MWGHRLCDVVGVSNGFFQTTRTCTCLNYCDGFFSCYQTYLVGLDCVRLLNYWFSLPFSLVYQSIRVYFTMFVSCMNIEISLNSSQNVIFQCYVRVQQQMCRIRLVFLDTGWYIINYLYRLLILLITKVGGKYNTYNKSNTYPLRGTNISTRLTSLFSVSQRQCNAKYYTRICVNCLLKIVHMTIVRK